MNHRILNSSQHQKERERGMPQEVLGQFRIPLISFDPELKFSIRESFELKPAPFTQRCRSWGSNGSPTSPRWYSRRQQKSVGHGEARESRGRSPAGARAPLSSREGEAMHTIQSLCFLVFKMGLRNTLQDNGFQCTCSYTYLHHCRPHWELHLPL